jgi:hypothetical protein
MSTPPHRFASGPEEPPGEPTKRPSGDQTAVTSTRPEDTVAFRPRHRPALAWLGILDDGGEAGEWVRLRKDHFVLGRTEGDITIPFDNLISSRHAELYRSEQHGKKHWTLRDLNSTNGTYAKILEGPLESGHHLVLGGKHYRFDDPLSEARTRDPSADDDAEPTRRGVGNARGMLVPSLVELTEEGEGRRLPLDHATSLVGRDPAVCGVAWPDDPMLSPKHARVYRDQQGAWRIEDLGSRNGVWLRVQKVRFRRTSHFQLGEQRFILKLGPSGA